MTDLFRGFFSSSHSRGGRSSDFSDFFTKSSGEKAKVVRQVLREANAEQKKLVGEFKKKTAN